MQINREKGYTTMRKKVRHKIHQFLLGREIAQYKFFRLQEITARHPRQFFKFKAISLAIMRIV